MKPAGIVFDLDGTLVDNSTYHCKAWQALFETLGKTLTYEEYKTNINGRRMKDNLFSIFGRQLSDKEETHYASLKDDLYKKLYAPFIKPIDGLIPFLQEVYNSHIPVSMATSAPPSNVQFLFDHVPIEKYFNGVIDSTQISKGKPDPEVFLKAAKSICADAIKCIAFEDSIAGIKAAKAAGMKVVALTTSEKRENIKEADLIIDDYSEVNVAIVSKLLSA